MPSVPSALAPGTPRNLYGVGGSPGCTTKTCPVRPEWTSSRTASATSSVDSNGKPALRNSSANGPISCVSVKPGQIALIVMLLGPQLLAPRRARNRRRRASSPRR